MEVIPLNGILWNETANTFIHFADHLLVKISTRFFFKLLMKFCWTQICSSPRKMGRWWKEETVKTVPDGILVILTPHFQHVSGCL